MPRCARERLLAREGVEPGSELALRYSGAQELYERDARPRDAASAIVDNTDPTPEAVLRGLLLRGLRPSDAATRLLRPRRVPVP